MDSTTPYVFLLLSIITIYHIGFGTALHVEVYPKKVNELVNNEVNITCYPSESPDGDGNVILVELGKVGEHPIAILEKAELNYGPDRKMNVKADGRIVKDSAQSFLRLTISDPGAGDAGTYSCSVFYSDGFGQIREDKKEANVTVENGNDNVLVHLLKKVSDLEKTADRQDKILKEQEKERKAQQDNTKNLEKDLKAQQTITKNLEKDLKAQQNNTKNMEKDLKAQQNNTNILENTVAQQKKELKEQQDKTNALEKTVAQQEKQLEDQRTNETVTIAFSYAYNKNDKLVKGQPMLFRNKIMSIGDSYDPKSGVFTAPRDGLYVFHLLVMTHTYDYINIHLTANGEGLAWLWVRNVDVKDQGSVSSVTSLKAGDQVKAVVNSFTPTHDDAWDGEASTLTGYLLKLL